MWNEIGKDVQHLIIWRYVCNTSPLAFSNKLVDKRSMCNAYLAGKQFHVLKEWERKLIPTMDNFEKDVIEKAWMSVDWISFWSLRRIYCNDEYISKYINTCNDQYIAKVDKLYSEKEIDHTTLFDAVNEYTKKEYMSINSNPPPEIINIATQCCRGGMGKLTRYLINVCGVIFNEKVLKTCIENAIECGDLDMVSWLYDKYQLTPDDDSMDEALLLASSDIIHYCIVKFGYSINMQVIMDSLRMNNIKVANMALKEKFIHIDDIHFNDIRYIYDLFMYKCVETLKVVIQYDKISNSQITDAFLTHHLQLYEVEMLSCNLASNAAQTLALINRELRDKIHAQLEKTNRQYIIGGF